MKRLVLVGLAVIVAVGIAGVAWHFRTNNSHPTLSAEIRKNIAFKAYVPSGEAYSMVAGSGKYDSSQPVLSMKIVQANQPELVLAEQPYPDTLIFDKLIGSMTPEREVGTALGKATITHPKSTPDKEVAVMQADTTLIFITSDKKLTDSAWREVFNSLQPLK